MQISLIKLEKPFKSLKSHENLYKKAKNGKVN